MIRVTWKLLVNQGVEAHLRPSLSESRQVGFGIYILTGLFGDGQILN